MRSTYAPSPLASALAELLGVDAKEIGFKHNASGTPAATGYAHGPGGALTYPGVAPDMFQTIVGNLPGLLAQLPTRASVFTDPLFQVLTGVTADSGDNPTNVCDTPPTGGLLKGCKFFAPFGRYEKRTREIEINRLGKFNDLADPMDLRMIGNPAITGTGIFQDPRGATLNPLANEMNKALWERAISFNRTLARQVWQGNPTNNTAGGGYKEFPGLDLLINTGHVDAETNTSCPSADSDVKDFNYLNIDGNGDDLINAVSYLFRYLRSLANRTNVTPVRWVIACREELFYELAAVWACSYQTYRCTNIPLAGGATNLNVDSGDVIQMRDDMRANQYLLIDGIRVDVIFDDGIAEDSNTTNGNVPNGSFASDLYFVPMSVLGGTATTFLEYFDMENGSIEAALQTGLLSDVRASGAWLEWSQRTQVCVYFAAKIEPRLVLRTPWLAGRLQHLVYKPLQHTREAFPDDPYWVNGGLTTRTGPSYYASWKR